MKRRSKIILWILVGIWLILMAVLSPRLVQLHREKQVVRQTFASFGDSLVRRDFSAAYQFCGDDFRKSVPFEEFVKVQQSLQSQYGILESVNEAAYDVIGEGTPLYWRAVISADLVYRDRKIRFQFELHKEDQRWVMFGYRQL